MNLELRPWALSDAEHLCAAANNPKIAQYMTDSFLHPFTRENAEKFIHWTMNHCPSKVMAITVNGQAIGNIGIHPQTDILRKNAEIGYWIAEEYWGRGIMLQVIEKMIPLAFETFDIDRIFGRVYGHNIASQKMIEKAGFKLEARFEKTIFKNGAYCDELIYAFRK